MKKFFSYALILVAAIVLVACTKKEKLESDVILDKITITFANGESELTIKSDFELMSEVDGLDIKWTSSRTKVISIENFKATVTRGTSEDFVNLTAYITIDGELVFKTFNLKVLAA